VKENPLSLVEQCLLYLVTEPIEYLHALRSLHFAPQQQQLLDFLYLLKCKENTHFRITNICSKENLTVLPRPHLPGTPDQLELSCTNGHAASLHHFCKLHWSAAQRIDKTVPRNYKNIKRYLALLQVTLKKSYFLIKKTHRNAHITHYTPSQHL